MPRKSIRYPKKLRLKLEKVAAGAAARELENDEESVPENYRPLWHEFLPTNGLAFMYTRAHDDLRKLTSHHFIEMPSRASLPSHFPDVPNMRTHPKVLVAAPWESASSS